MQEGMTFDVTGFFTVTDLSTGEVIHKTNAIHYGNLAASIVHALSTDDKGHVGYIAFGNGGSSIDPTGQVIYKSPNTGVIRDINASLYNETFYKPIDETNLSVNLGTGNYSDLKIKVTLDFDEPGLETQDTINNSVTNEGEYIFDELAIYTGAQGIQVDNISESDPETDEKATLITHVIFHPIQKALNSSLEIDYTIRIQMSN